jgi:hypothetical protein
VAYLLCATHGFMIRPDPAGCLQHYPVDMSTFGLNPFGENQFRLVLASSRRSLVCGQWNDAGMPRAKYCQTYPQVPAGEYILEKWLDAFTFAGPRSRWDLEDGQFQGPYPSRGEYVMCGSTGFDPMQVNIEKLITLVHASDRFSWAEKLNACRTQAEKEETDKSFLREAIIRDAFPAFGHAPFSQISTGRGGAGKTSPVLRSANELGLPVPQGIPGQATSGGSMIVPKRKRRKVA